MNDYWIFQRLFLHPLIWFFFFTVSRGWITLRFVKQNTGHRQPVRGEGANCLEDNKVIQGQAPPREVQTLLPTVPRYWSCQENSLVKPWMEMLLLTWSRESASALERPAVPGSYQVPPAPVAGLLAEGTQLVPQEENCSASSKSLKWWELRVCLGAVEYTFKQSAYWFWNRDDVPEQGGKPGTGCRPLSLSVRNQSRPRPRSEVA